MRLLDRIVNLFSKEAVEKEGRGEGSAQGAQEQKVASKVTQQKTTAQGSSLRKVTASERNDFLARECATKLALRLEEDLVRSKRSGIRYRYYKEGEDMTTDNIVTLEAVEDRKGEVILQIGVTRSGTDRMYSNYLFEAGENAKEIKAWLNESVSCVPVLVKCAEELAEMTRNEYEG